MVIASFQQTLWTVQPVSSGAVRQKSLGMITCVQSKDLQLSCSLLIPYVIVIKPDKLSKVFVFCLVKINFKLLEIKQGVQVDEMIKGKENIDLIKQTSEHSRYTNNFQTCKTIDKYVWGRYLVTMI